MGILSRLFANRRTEPRERVLPAGYYTNAVEAPAEDAEWIKVVPLGSFPFHHSGGHELTEEVITQMAANFEGVGTDLLFDVDHESMWGHTRAAGWSTELEVRDDGLYARAPELTPYGEERVGSKEYRYLSPVYALNAVDRQGNPIGAVLDSVAYTNRPYFDRELTAVNHKTNADPDMSLRDALVSKLELGDDATDDQIAEAIANSRPAPEPETPPTPEPTTDPAGDGSTDADNPVLAEVRKLNSRVEALEQKDRDPTALVEAAVAAGKIKPAEKAIYVNAATADYDGTKQALDAIAANAAMPGRVQTDTAVNSDGELVEISREDARDARKYRNARERAEKAGARLVVVDED